MLRPQYWHKYRRANPLAVTFHLWPSGHDQSHGVATGLRGFGLDRTDTRGSWLEAAGHLERELFEAGGSALEAKRRCLGHSTDALAFTVGFRSSSVSVSKLASTSMVERMAADLNGPSGSSEATSVSWEPSRTSGEENMGAMRGLVAPTNIGGLLPFVQSVPYVNTNSKYLGQFNSQALSPLRYLTPNHANACLFCE